MKYFFITFLISTFVIVYVWQNIEVMKIKMTYNRLLVEEKKLENRKKRLLYELERSRNFRNVEKIAMDNGYRELRPSDVIYIESDLKKIENKKAQR